MSGGGGNSDPNAYSSSLPSAGVDPGQLAQFSQSEAAQGFSPEEMAALQKAQVAPNGTWYVNGQISQPVAEAYQGWLANTAANNGSWQNYATLSQQEEGRDATILTGPQVSPTVMGGH